MLDREIILEEMIKTNGIPGASVAIAKGQNSPELYQAGIIDVTNPQPVEKKTIFEAASLSKPVFAYIVLKQVEKGLLSRSGESPESGLDIPLYEICDFGPPHMRNDPNYKKLTVRMLLSHQARLPNEFVPGDEKYIAPEDTRGFDYSGEAYRFLNDVIKHVTNNKSLDVLSREIFDSPPLEMKNSSFIPHPDGSPQREMRAIGHDSNNIKDVTEHFSRQFPHPAGSLLTTAEDYIKFMRALTQDKFISQHLFEKPVPLTQDKKAIDKVPPDTLNCLAWGMGLGLQRTNQGMIAFHWGDVNTNRSFCAINLETNNAVVCLTNSANGPAIFKQIAEPVVGDLSPALTWLKMRGENQPVFLKETKKSIESPSIVSQSMFSESKRSTDTATQKEEPGITDKEMTKNRFGRDSSED